MDDSIFLLNIICIAQKNSKFSAQFFFFSGMSDSGSVGDGHTQQAGAARLSRGASRNTSLRNSKEDVSKGNDPNTGGNKIEEIPAVGQDATGVTIECAVCLQTCVHPVKLPCSHIFCFLCVKGVAFQSRRCAMCRQEIPSDVLLHPQLVDRTQLEKESVLEDGYQWFYEGRNGEFKLLLYIFSFFRLFFFKYSSLFIAILEGWWKYDERTTADLEEVYNKGQETTVELLIAGASYVVDFKRLVQYPKYRPGRIRKIRRGGGQDDPAASALPKLGVAGIRFS